MAVIWQRRVGDHRYEVRSAGRTRRLYTNGVFHSQYNPAAPVTGGVWDLLTLAAFADPASMRRALVLGVGGGAVVRQLRRFLDLEVTGVELDPVHLDVARRHFGVGPEVRLEQAEAGRWLDGYDGPPFDLVVDDLFSHEGGEPRRAVTADAGWLHRLARRLAPHGVLAVNFISRREFRACGWHADARLRRRFPAGWTLTTPLHENVVAVFLPRPLPAEVLRRHLEAVPELDPRRRTTRLRYRLRGFAVPPEEAAS